jgi:hypothetical protein
VCIASPQDFATLLRHLRQLGCDRVDLDPRPEDFDFRTWPLAKVLRALSEQGTPP